MINYLAIIQARIGSERVPGKVLKPLGNKTVLKFLIDRIRESQYIENIVVATADNDENASITNYCNKEQITCITGSENDVCSRFKKASDQFPSQNILRFCADSPFQDPQIIDEVIKYHQNQDADYTTNGWHTTRSFPLGVDVRLFKTSLLDICINKRKNTQLNKENPIAYIHDNINQFKTALVEAPQKLNRKDLRFILDYPEDYDILQEIVANIEPAINFSTLDLIKFSDNRPHLIDKMKMVKVKLRTRNVTTSKDVSHLF